MNLTSNYVFRCGEKFSEWDCNVDKKRLFYELTFDVKKLVCNNDFNNLSLFKDYVESFDLDQKFIAFFNHSFDVMLENYSFVSYLNQFRGYNFSNSFINSLVLGGFLHDIGKLESSIFELINKPGKLTNYEFEKVKKHTLVGSFFLKEMFSCGLLDDFSLNKEDLLSIVSQHHLYSSNGGSIADGGYILPHSGVLVQLSLCSQITRISDVYSALVSERPYGRIFSSNEALKKMMKINAVNPFNNYLFKEFIKYKRCVNTSKDKIYLLKN